MKALQASYKCLVLSMVLGLLVGFFSLVPTTVATVREELSVVGGACDCSGIDHKTCPGCTSASYTRCMSDPPDTGTCKSDSVNCQYTNCTGQRNQEQCD